MEWVALNAPWTRQKNTPNAANFSSIGHGYLPYSPLDLWSINLVFVCLVGGPMSCAVKGTQVPRYETGLGSAKCLSPHTPEF